MVHEVVAQPILPVHDMDLAADWYREVGFEVLAHSDAYAWVRLHGRELFHLAHAEGLDVRANPSACYLHVHDVEEWHVRCRAAGLEVSDVEVRPWDMREFHAVDPSGNLLRVGTNA